MNFRINSITIEGFKGFTDRKTVPVNSKKIKFKVVYGCGHTFYSNSHSIAQPCWKYSYPTCL